MNAPSLIPSKPRGLWPLPCQNELSAESSNRWPKWSSLRESVSANGLSGSQRVDPVANPSRFSSSRCCVNFAGSLSQARGIFQSFVRRLGSPCAAADSGAYGSLLSASDALEPYRSLALPGTRINAGVSAIYADGESRSSNWSPGPCCAAASGLVSFSGRSCCGTVHALDGAENAIFSPAPAEEASARDAATPKYKYRNAILSRLL